MARALEATPKAKPAARARRILVIDVGGTNVKLRVTGAKEPRRFPSGPTLTARRMVAEVKKVTAGWAYDVVSIGYPGPVENDRPVFEPHNLAKGWVRFDFRAAFRCPVRIVNDAAMQALGSYRGGRMLFLGLGTGLGSAMVADGVLLPMELAHLPYRQSTFEDYVGVGGYERLGKKRWKHHVGEVVIVLAAALRSHEVVLGGGNVKRLKGKLPPGCREGSNANAFVGGFRLWDEAARAPGPRRTGKRARA